MKIKLMNEQILIYGDPSEIQKMEDTGFFTIHPNVKNACYCLYNNYAIKFFTKYSEWFHDNVEGYSDIAGMFKKELDYAGKKDSPYKKKDLPGVILQDHQEICVNLMLNNERQCIFAGPGTGKTFMALTYLNSVTRQGSGNHVVIMPKNIMSQYVEEATKYLHSMVGVFTDAADFNLSTWPGHNILITNYERMANIRNIPLDTLIFDESHALKNFTSTANKRAQLLASLAESIYLFTGTPLDKNRFELFAQLKLLIPYAFPTKTSVLTRYFTVDDYYKPKAAIKARVSETDEIITSLCYGLDTEEVLDLPEMKNYILETRFQDKTLYNELTKEKFYEFPSGVVTAESGAALRTKQRQLCSGFIYLDDGRVIYTENPKLHILQTYLSKVAKSIIFVQFKPEIDIVQQECKSIGRSYGIVSGEHKDTAEDIRRFRAGELEILIMQIQSGSAGLDLSITNNILFYALPESAIVLKQGRYRIRRIGQTKTCNYFYIVTKGTVEKQRIMKNLNLKRETHVKEFKTFRRTQ